MQTFKDVFKREDERFNLINMGTCIAIVVLVVIAAFGFREMKFALLYGGGQEATPPAVVQTTGND